jgi:hypothetical protein
MKDIMNYFLTKQFYLFQDIDFFNLIQSGGKNNKKRWDKLFHNGPLFPPLYTPYNITIKINNTIIQFNITNIKNTSRIIYF